MVCSTDRKFIYFRPDCQFSGIGAEPNLHGCTQLRAFTPYLEWYLQKPGSVGQSSIAGPLGIFPRRVVPSRFLAPAAVKFPVMVAFTGDASSSLETSTILSASAARSPNSVFVEDARILRTSWGS